MTTTLLLLRHGKSDWSVPTSDVDRPLAARGVRQATEAGRWIAQHLEVELAIVSVAARAQQTWQLAVEERRDSEELYTFDGLDVLRVVRGLPPDRRCVALVGHNPAFEELVELLTGDRVQLKTSAIAVIELDAWSTAGDGQARLATHGRPPPESQLDR